MQIELANAIAKRFIARADAKAKQFPTGEYKPVRTGDINSDTVPWKRDDILAHLSGESTFGHYFLDKDNTTKLFAFDIDLETEGVLPDQELEIGSGLTSGDVERWHNSFIQRSPRECWRNRADPARTYLKTQFRELAGILASTIHKELEIECAVAYSGNKGIHVYGFTGRQPADAVRAGAEVVLDLIGGFSPQDKRASTYKHDSRWQHMAIEVFPKQIELSGGGFGNLMRLPLGKNQKSKDPTFFVDLTAPLNQLKPVDPLWALNSGAVNPWLDAA